MVATNRHASTSPRRWPTVARNSTTTILGSRPSTVTSGVLSELGRYDEAIEAQTEALRIEQLQFGERHPQVGLAMTALGADYSALGQYERALSLAQQAVEVLEEGMGQTHPAVINALINQGSTQGNAGLLDEAQQTYLEALKRARTLPGQPTRDVALILANLGVHNQQRGQLASSEDYLRQAVEAMSAAMGPEHPVTQRVEGTLAEVRKARAAEPSGG